MKLRLLSLLVLLACLPSQAHFIDDLWHDMQATYVKTVDQLTLDGLLDQESNYCHDIWKSTKAEIKTILLGSTDRYFARHYCVWNTMVRRGMSPVQAYEILFLKDCISPSTKSLLARYHEPDFLGLEKTCREFNCSTNALGHLFYAAKVFEQWPHETIQSIVELGSGYGNLASMFKQIKPEATIFLIDLPELLALQYFFLKATQDAPVIMHSRVPEKFEESAIHLIPVYLLPQLTLKADLFISTFALSESSAYTQEMVVAKKFFDAQYCYISGQLHGWGNEFKFVNHAPITDAVRNCYAHVQCQPHHVSLHVMPSYELIARK
ncbi:hypothetical protein Noda2021_07420 [Candidatus Dependentiae bacterium Noda2021]|nr:hypothetical protein Noda2021_07420 [Candidatus Dependentiae bacterium Noda2021]